MSTIKLSVTTARNIDTLEKELQVPGTKAKHSIMRNLISILEKLCSGGDRSSPAISINLDDNAVAASGTVTFSSFAADDTVTVGTQVFTAKVSPSGANQFALGASDTEAAAALVVKINAHTSLTGVVTATSAAAVITVTASVKGLIGNQIGTAISAHGSVAAAKLANGAADSAAVTLSF